MVEASPELSHMKKLRIGRVLLFLVLLVGSIGYGCAGVTELAPTHGLTKDRIIAAWKREPDRIFTNGRNLKYGADEVWVYIYPDSDEDRFYFKDDVLIREENITYGSI